MKTFLILPILLAFLLLSLETAFAQTGTVTATVRVNPLTVEIFAPGQVSVGERFSLEANVSNLGQTKIDKTKATVFAPGNVNIMGQQEKNLGNIPSNSSKTAKWQMSVSEPSGDIVITVVAEGIESESGDVVTAQDSETIQVLSSPTSFFSLLLSFLRSMV